MQNQELSRQIQRLKSLIAATNRACKRDAQMQSAWAKYICVLSAGLIENAIKVLYIDYAARQVSEPVARYVSQSLNQIRSPKMSRFLEVSSSFKMDWKDDLESFSNHNGRDLAIDSIINNRHYIAHGQEQRSNLSLYQICEYLDKASKVLEFIEQQCSQ
jgi:hypothetical protein